MGLSSFGKTKAPQKLAEKKVRAGRGTSKRIQVSVRVSRDEWTRMHREAIDKNISLIGLCKLALSQYFVRQGEMPFDSVDMPAKEV